MTFVRFACLSLALGSLLLGGCVTPGEYDKTEATAKSLESQVQQLRQQNQDLQESERELTQTIAQLRQAVDQREQQLQGRDQQIADLNQQLDEYGGLEQDLLGLNDRIRTELGSSRINPRTSQALSRLAASRPDLMLYDARTGTLRFTSDLTFASGSAVVREEVKSALRQLAEILSSPDGSVYEVHVIGHTDSQTISNPDTKRQHPNNRYLSVHRAIAVSESLQEFGVPAGRIETSGWGQYRPIVPNAANGNTPANRRVEVQLVLPAEDSAATPPPSGDTTPMEQAQPETRRFPIK